MSRSGYIHSEVFARLKNIKETVTEQYTTYQWLSVLDHFIESAIDPIATAYPDLADVYFAKVVAWQSHRPSVKYSRDDKFKLPVLLFNSLTTQGREKREYQKKMLLNRGLLFGLISTFEKTVNSYMRLHDPYLRIKKSRRQALIALAEQRTKSSHLYSAVMQSRYYAKKAYWFKELIVQKYTRLALMHAKKAYEDTDFVISLNDIIQIYLIYLAKAIDRCDSRQGVLTTFIQTWFYSAKAEIMKLSILEGKTSSYEELLETGMASHSIDPDNRFELVQHICVTAKQLDPQGCLRFALGIPETFSSVERRKLMLFAVE